MTRYGLIHFRRDVTDDITEGQLLGCDEVGRFYAVIDAEYDAERDRTDVHLQYATPEQVTVHFASQEVES